MHIYRINSFNLIKSLSLSLELLSSNLSYHHWRVAIIAIAIANEMELPYQRKTRLLYASLLHDIGAASSDWNSKLNLRYKNLKEKIVQKRYLEHAYRGYLLLKKSRCFRDLADIVLHHHDEWEKTKDEDISLESRILHVADRIEVSIKANEYILLQSDDIIKRICSYSGTVFQPEVIEAFVQAARKESFWLNIVERSYEKVFEKENCYYGYLPYTDTDIVDIAKLFAKIIDQYSSFTFNHSYNVSRIAVYLAQKKGFSSDELKSMIIAGLLHDIGKLSVPNSVLDNPNKLNTKDYALIRQHTYYTYRILQQIDGFGQIAEWAAYHHEHLDGSGYPFHLQADALSLGARIVAVADIAVALQENRPYRNGMDIEKTKSIIGGLVKDNKIDGSIVEILFDNFNDILDHIHQNV